MTELAVKDYLSKDRVLADMIPYSHHVSDTVIATKNGEYISTIKLVGRSHIAADIEDVNNWVAALNTNLRSIPGDVLEHLGFWVHVVRRKEKKLTKKIYNNEFSTMLEEHYNDLFADDANSLMVNDLYITVCYRPIIEKVTGFFAKFEKSSLEERIEMQEAYIQKVEDVIGLMMQGLRAYEPIQLGVYHHNGRMFCQILEFFMYLISHKKQRVPVTRERYNIYLATNRLLFSEHGEIGEIRHIETSKFFGMLEIKEYDNITVPGHFNCLLQSDCELVVSQSFTTTSKIASLGFLKRHKKFLIDSEDVAVSQIDQIDQALDQLQAGSFVMGEHHMTVCVYEDSPTLAKNQLQSISTDLTEVGIVPTFLDLALESGFFAQLPANFSHRPRPAPITSLNFWCFNSLHNFMSGKAKNNPWGDAISMFKSVSGTPYFFNFHHSPKNQNSLGKMVDGNTIIFGKTGSGKTTLANFLLAQALSIPNLRLVAFDKDQGLEVFIRAVGGKYLPLRLGENTGFNPFQLPDDEPNRKFLKRWIMQLLAGDGLTVSFNDEKEIDQAIKMIYEHEQENRRLSVFVQSLPNPSVDAEEDAKPSVNQRLKKWCKGGDYAWVFDNEKDTLNVNSHSVYGFDVTHFLEAPELRSVIVMYLTYRTQEMINGQPFIYFFDEFWRLIQDKQFQDLFENKLKTIRKENGICIFASQEPNDALKTEIAKTMVSQCATQILLENPKADYEDYTKGLKLSDTEFDIVRNIPERSHQFLVRQGRSGQASLLEFYLPNFDKEMLVLSGTPENAELVNDIMDRLGSDDPKLWLPVFFKEHGFN